jgi:hypothetical protein
MRARVFQAAREGTLIPAAIRACPLLADTVEKVFSGWGPKFYRAADAFHAQQSEGLRRFSEKRPWSFVSTLRRIAVVELPQNQIWRDF